MSGALVPAAPTPATTPLPWHRALLLLALLLLAAWAGHALRPRHSLAEGLPSIDLAVQVPTEIGEWRLDSSIVPVLPDPTLQAKLAATYDQTLARTYVNPIGERVMLTIAYGRDQSSEATAVHRPEFCYGAQGFRVLATGVERLTLGEAEDDASAVTVQRLVATLGRRVEPITYWVTLGDEATLPGVGRKLKQLRHGVAGNVADGMLVRVSSLNPLTPEPVATGSPYALQDRFLRDLMHAVPPTLRARYFGI